MTSHQSNRHSFHPTRVAEQARLVAFSLKHGKAVEVYRSSTGNVIVQPISTRDDRRAF